MRLRTRVPFLTRATRGLVKGSSVYLVPRADGEIVLGATQEELGFDTRVTAGGLWELLRDARELLPGITELEFAEVSAGLRPGSPDNAPVMGRPRCPASSSAPGISATASCSLRCPPTSCPRCCWTGPSPTWPGTSPPTDSPPRCTPDEGVRQW